MRGGADVSRRRFLHLSFASLATALVALGAAPARAATLSRTYTATVGLLWGTLGFELSGTLTETVDRAAGSYHVLIEGRGPGIANRAESRGALRDNRWIPLVSESWFSVAGRESRTTTRYDWEERRVAFSYRGETFLLRRARVGEDLLALPPGVRVDDTTSIILNLTDGRWQPDSGGRLSTHVVRRQRPQGEGPDDALPSYTAELVPFTLGLELDGATGRRTAVFDMTRFSGWAREGEPARIVFAPDGRPERITTKLILGSSVAVRFS